MVLAGTLLGCGKGKSSASATGKFCNNLIENGSDFEGYLNFYGDGVDTTWYAYSGECTVCTGMPAGKNLSFEFGDESDWMIRFTKTLEIDGEYLFMAELDDYSDPTIGVYRPKAGYTCEDIGL